MEKRKLGRSGLEIAPIVFGGNVFGWSVDQARANALLDRVCRSRASTPSTRRTPIRAGYRTALDGESEIIIGKWLKTSGKRDRVLIFTKVGSEISADRKGLSRRHIIAECEGSLKRLGIDTIDLYQSHRDDAVHADGGDASGLCRIDPGGQSARDRRLQFHARSA